MPTPNWGPRAGQEMTQEEFDAYVVANPQGINVNNVYWGGRTPTADPVNPQAERGGNPTPEMAGLTYWQNFFNRGPNTAQMPGFNTANQAQGRDWQQQLIQGLQKQAAGDPDSLAQQQLRQSFGDATAQQTSLASTMRGQSAGAAMRGAVSGQQALQRQLPGQSQMLMLQEQQGAQAALAQMLAQQNAQDTALAQGLAQNQLGAQDLNQTMSNFYAQSGLNAGLTQEQLKREQALARLGINQGYSNLADDASKRLAQMGASALSTAGQLSKDDR